MKKIVVVIGSFLMLLSMVIPTVAANEVTCWFPPGWKAKRAQAISITEALTEQSGITIKPRIAKSYPEILQSFSSQDYGLVYVGSFVQTIIYARGIGDTLVQNINGKELYSGIMLYRAGDDPETILANHPDQIAYTVGASSGESSAKAATSGKAAMGVLNHGAAAGAVKAGKAKAAVVKNWWWEKNKAKFPTLSVYRIPGVSLEKNPDNVLTASRSLPVDMAMKISTAAISSKEAFGATEMTTFDKTKLQFSLELMKKGGIDPLTYSWN